MIQLICSKCGAALQAPEEYVGRSARCKSCGNRFIISVMPSRSDLIVNDPPELEGKVRAELKSGEILTAYCMFHVRELAFLPLVGLIGQSHRVVTALTDRYLRFMRFQRKVSFMGKKSWSDVLASNNVETRLITGISTKKAGGNVQWDIGFENPALNSSILGSGPAAERFMDELEQIIHRKLASPADEIGKLAVLVKEGVLTTEDFQKAKELLLGRTPDERDLALSNLRQLFALHQAGVLTEGEFRLKKWDILSRR